MADKLQQEVNIAAVLDAFVYLDKQKTAFRGKTLRQIVEHMSNNPDEADWAYYDIVKNALADEKLANMRLVSQSSIDAGISNDLLYACTFVSDSGDYYVAYRGTGDGKWVDNGEGMYKTETVMQRAASDYFDLVADREHLHMKDHVIVTGHSKGGNSAQFVTLASKHRALIDSCYSFDGQGFSAKAIEMFKSELGTVEYQTQIEKMVAINGQNDFVHGLGFVVIPQDQTHLVETSGSDLGSLHALQNMFSNGRIVINDQLEPGPVAKFIDVLSKEMMSLDDEDLEDCALAMMSLIEALDGEDHFFGTGDVKFASIEEFCGFISVGIPMILKTALTTEEGRALVGTLAMGAIKDIVSSENGVWKLVGIAAIALVCAPAVVSIGKSILNVASYLDTVLGVFDGRFELSDIGGAAIVARAVAHAAMFFGGNPHILAAVLTFAAVVSFVVFVIQHWDEIAAFAKAAGDFVVAAMVAIYTWAENLVAQATALIKSAIGKAAEFYQNAKQAVIDFGNSLLSAAAGFFSGIAQAISGTFGGIASWVKSLFGSGTAALEYGSQIVVTISYIDNLQYRIGILRSNYLSLSSNIKNADGVVSRIYVYYTESYVRNCCRNIQTELKNAQKYLSSIEKDLERKRRALSAAVESYRRADQSAANEIRKFSVNCA